jgi:hypothetical protein
VPPRTPPDALAAWLSASDEPPSAPPPANDVTVALPMRSGVGTEGAVDAAAANAMVDVLRVRPTPPHPPAGCRVSALLALPPPVASYLLVGTGGTAAHPVAK